MAPESLPLIHRVYPETRRHWGDELPPSRAVAGAIEDIRGTLPPGVTVWTPDARPRLRPIDALAILGAIRLGEWIGREIAWDGERLTAPRGVSVTQALCDLPYHWEPDGGSLYWGDLRRSVYRDQLAWGAERMAPKRGAKLWTGQVTSVRVWESCRACVVALALQSAMDRGDRPQASDWPAIEKPAIMFEHAPAHSGYSATGYDPSQVLDASQLGFSPLAGGQTFIARPGSPAIEMLSMIGASELEFCRRWERREEPSIPDPLGWPLRDTADLYRFVCFGPDLPVQVNWAGEYRAYLGEGV